MKFLISIAPTIAVIAILAAVFVPPLMAEKERFNAIFQCLGKDCMVIELNDQFLTGTDGACAATGMFLVDLFKKYPHLKTIVIANQGWIPSLYRTVDREWAECLADPDLMCEDTPSEMRSGD